MGTRPARTDPRSSLVAAANPPPVATIAPSEAAPSLLPAPLRRVRAFGAVPVRRSFATWRAARRRSPVRTPPATRTDRAMRSAARSSARRLGEHLLLADLDIRDEQQRPADPDAVGLVVAAVGVERRIRRAVPEGDALRRRGELPGDGGERVATDDDVGHEGRTRGRSRADERGSRARGGQDARGSGGRRRLLADRRQGASTTQDGHHDQCGHRRRDRPAGPWRRMTRSDVEAVHGRHPDGRRRFAVTTRPPARVAGRHAAVSRRTASPSRPASAPAA